MGVISTNKREIKLFYNAETSVGMQTLAYLKASKKKILDVDLSKTKVTGTQWTELAKRLEKPIKELINIEHPDFMKEYGKTHDLHGDEDWLKVLVNNPKVVTQPILVNGDKVIQIDTPSRVMSFLEEEEDQN
ncbi:hypothetical protein Murru_0794 [Allomuricauda ruestringensis DSM 13258]|uniref:Arsenate reductase like protein n=1 Tax=Allomuricauda ruestringensis (strain DSM 13258 / CIP 107369 / LMG 19739 / B1) TaxID=886377 RepID=G2PK69_ALLRU|nr:hypothetical protein [Allomuricauda ruestringensis]AEM69843.1 hypothetical protein Murru_0794 [Allomuricauda ruestringensis DSM 13258]